MTDLEKIALFLMRKSESARFDMLMVLIEAMMDQDLIRYREKDDDPEFGEDEDLYWESCGDSLFGENK